MANPSHAAADERRIELGTGAGEEDIAINARGLVDGNNNLLIGATRDGKLADRSGNQVAVISATGVLATPNGDPLPPLESIVTVAASRDLALTDAGCYLRVTGASPVSLTLPLDADVPLPVGTRITVRNAGSSTVDFPQEEGVTLNTPTSNQLTAVHGVVTLRKVAANEWDAYGDLATV